VEPTEDEYLHTLQGHVELCQRRAIEMLWAAHATEQEIAEIVADPDKWASEHRDELTPWIEARNALGPGFDREVTHFTQEHERGFNATAAASCIGALRAVRQYVDAVESGELRRASSYGLLAWNMVLLASDELTVREFTNFSAYANHSNATAPAKTGLDGADRRWGAKRDAEKKALQDWRGVDNDYVSKIEFGKAYVSLLFNEYGVKVSAETIAYDWLNGERLPDRPIA
jgi:hypothetical protein